MHPPTKTPPEAAEHPYDNRGVDIMLIRWMLEMTPAERVQVLQSSVDAILNLRPIANWPGAGPGSEVGSVAGPAPDSEWLRPRYSRSQAGEDAGSPRLSHAA